MGVNINDRRRISSLIQEEFRARREAATEKPSDAAIEAEMDAIISRSHLTAKVKALGDARRQVETLEKALSVAVTGLKKQKRRSRRYDGCECHEDFEEPLRKLATANLTSGADKADEKLATEQRKLLAKVEVAKTVDDIEKVLKAAGLA